MLVGLKQPLEEGGELPMTLEFERAGAIDVRGAGQSHRARHIRAARPIAAPWYSARRQKKIARDLSFTMGTSTLPSRSLSANDESDLRRALPLRDEEHGTRARPCSWRASSRIGSSAWADTARHKAASDCRGDNRAARPPSRACRPGSSRNAPRQVSSRTASATPRQPTTRDRNCSRSNWASCGAKAGPRRSTAAMARCSASEMRNSSSRLSSSITAVTRIVAAG